MKGTATAFALGFAVPAAAQTVPPAQDAPPEVFLPAHEPASDFRLENIKTPLAGLALDLRERRRDCAQNLTDTIVVCARRDDDACHRLGSLPDIGPVPTTIDDLRKALTVKIGPVTITPGGSDKMVGVGISIDF